MVVSGFQRAARDSRSQNTSTFQISACVTFAIVPPTKTRTLAKLKDTLRGITADILQTTYQNIDSANASKVTSIVPGILWVLCKIVTLRKVRKDDQIAHRLHPTPAMCESAWSFLTLCESNPWRGRCSCYHFTDEKVMLRDVKAFFWCYRPNKNLNPLSDPQAPQLVLPL